MVSVPISKQLTLSAAFQTIHTVYRTRQLTISIIHLVNCTAAPVTVQLCFVPSGGTPAQANAALWTYSIPAHDFIQLSEGQILPSDYSVQALASAPSAINLLIAGREE